VKADELMCVRRRGYTAGYRAGKTNGIRRGREVERDQIVEFLERVYSEATHGSSSLFKRAINAVKDGVFTSVVINQVIDAS